MNKSSKKKSAQKAEKNTVLLKLGKKDDTMAVTQKQSSAQLSRQRSEQLAYCYGLDQVELGHTKPDERHALASRLWESELRLTWRKFYPPLHDYGFIPACLSEYSARIVRKHGVAGIHFAEGWEGLYNMYVMCGGDLMNYRPEPTAEMINRRSDGAQNAVGIEVKKEDNETREDCGPKAANKHPLAKGKDCKQSDPLMLLSSVAEKTGSGWKNSNARTFQQDKNSKGEVDLDIIAPPRKGAKSTAKRMRCEDYTAESNYDEETVTTNSVEDRKRRKSGSKRSDLPFSHLLVSASTSKKEISSPILQPKKRRARRAPERFASLRQVSLSEIPPLPADKHEEKESEPPLVLFKQQSSLNSNSDTTSRLNIQSGSDTSVLKYEAPEEEAGQKSLEERVAKMEKQIRQLERIIRRREEEKTASAPLGRPTLTPSPTRQTKTLSERIDILERVYLANLKCQSAKEGGNTGTGRVKRLEIILFGCIQSGGLVSRVERMENL